MWNQNQDNSIFFLRPELKMIDKRSAHHRSKVQINVLLIVSKNREFKSKFFDFNMS
jgi:hypothetical protein